MRSSAPEISFIVEPGSGAGVRQQTDGIGQGLKIYIWLLQAVSFSEIGLILHPHYEYRIGALFSRRDGKRTSPLDQKQFDDLSRLKHKTSSYI